MFFAIFKKVYYIVICKIFGKILEPFKIYDNQKNGFRFFKNQGDKGYEFWLKMGLTEYNIAKHYISSF